MSINKVILVGNVGADPEVKHLENNNCVANFSLATSESYKDKNGERQTITEWHRVVVWGKTAELVEKYVVKGSSLYLEGQIKTRSWEQDNVKRYTTEIVLSGFNSVLKFIGKKPEAPTTGAASEQAPPPQGQEVDDDLPF